MAINYSAGLNPMIDRFSQQVQQSSNQQRLAQQMMQAKEDDRFRKLLDIGGTIGSAVRNRAKKEVDQFKADTNEEQKRLETLRDKYSIGSDSYVSLNNQISGLKDRRDEQIKSYRDSGFLGFGKDREELDLYKNKTSDAIKRPELYDELEKGDFTDPNTGLLLKNRDLSTSEKRRYQEGKEKTARSAQMKIKLGMPLNDAERQYFGNFSDQEISRISETAMQPELRQKAQDFINQGITLDPNNTDHQAVAKAMNSTVGNLQTMINDAYEDNLYQDIQRAGTDYNALAKIQERAKGKNLTSLTDDRLGDLVEQAKQANRDDIYNQVRQAVNSSDPGENFRVFALRNNERVQRLFDDGVIDKKQFSAQMRSIKKGVIDPHNRQLQTGQETKQINLLQKLVEQRSLEKFRDPNSQNPELEQNIRQLGDLLKFNSNALLNDATEQKKLKNRNDQLTTLSKKLSVGEQIRKKIYNEIYGSGSVTITNMTDEGSIAYSKTDGSGQLDPNKLKEAFARSYSSIMQTAPDKQQLDEFVENILEYNKVVKLGLTPEERGQKFVDIAN